MKIKKNEVMFLLAFFGVLAAVLVYVQVYLPTLEQTDILLAENTQHAARVAELEEIASKVDTYIDDTEKMIVDVNGIFAKFPSESRSEDAIMYAVELESQDRDTYISAIGIGEPAVAYTAAPTTVPLNTSDEAGERVYELKKQQITYTQEFDYDGMKRFVDSIVQDPERRSIETVTMAYDSGTGQLHGTTAMNLFTLTGTEKEYEATRIPYMSIGTDNIFGTFDFNENNDNAEQPTEE